MGMNLIGYLSLGYPSLPHSLETANVYARSGCDIIEIGYPTDNAYLDNDIIKNQLKTAYEKNNNPKSFFNAIKKLKNENSSVGSILLIYEHSIVEIGFDRFVKLCRESRIEDIILVGNKDNKIKNKLIKCNFKVSVYVTFDLPNDAVNEAINSNGFVYLQAKPSGKIRPGCKKLKDCIKYLRNKGIKTPIYVGVGMSNSDDVNMAAMSGADGVFIGSALLEKQSNYEQLGEFINELKKATQL